MSENIVPKWQRELRSFLGIKSGIVLEGNVYDEYPFFDYSGPEPALKDIDDLNHTVLSLVDSRQTTVVFFDPVNGFYCDEGPLETQRQVLRGLFAGYNTRETTTNHDCTVCIMPTGKGNGSVNRNSDERERYIWVSEIVRRVISEGLEIGGRGNIVIVLNFASRLDACNFTASEANTMFLNLMAATTATQRTPSMCSSVVMVVDKYNDIPAWVYMNNPNIRTISICMPERSVRRLFLDNLHGDLVSYACLSRSDDEAGKRFVAETDGLRLQEMRQILKLARRMDILPQNIDLAFRLYKYGVLDNPWESLENDILLHIESRLKERVKGQDEAIAKVKTVVTRAVNGLSGLQHSGASRKPKGVLFFAGPTGVGKTETVKALAEAIFGDENAMIRFDMSEYRLEQSDQKLFGAPPGYVGYEGGGQLTNAVRDRPFSILLFDEIEKASPTILDKFLQILEDGRMTDNQGNTVYFGECIIVFTSNIGLTREDPSSLARPGSVPHRIPTITIEEPEKEDTPEFRQRVTRTLTEGVKAYFNDNGRPELLNRLGEDNIIVFQYINKKDAEAICEYKLALICRAIRETKGIDILTDEIKEELKQLAVKERANGGRGIGNMLEREFQNTLSSFLCTQQTRPTVLRCHLDAERKVIFEVMG